MSFLHLVNQALLADRPEVMPQVLLFLQQKRYLDAAQLLRQHTQLPRSDAEDFVAHHVQNGEMSTSLASGPLLTAVHKAMQLGDTKHALYLLQAARGKAMGVKVPEPESVPKQLMKGLLIEAAMYLVVVIVGLVGLFILIRHI
jgi:hypothetical protein